MMQTTITRSASIEGECSEPENSGLSVYQRAEKTIEELLVLNEKGLSFEQVERFVRACATLRAGDSLRLRF
jgi:hypothetical protein